MITGTKTMFEAMAYPPFAYLLLWWLPSVPMIEGDQIWTAVTYLVVIAVSVVLNVRAFEAIGKDWRQHPGGWWPLGGQRHAVDHLHADAQPDHLWPGVVAGDRLAFPGHGSVLPRRFEGSSSAWLRRSK